MIYQDEKWLRKGWISRKNLWEHKILCKKDISIDINAIYAKGFLTAKDTDGSEEE